MTIPLFCSHCAVKFQIDLELTFVQVKGPAFWYNYHSVFFLSDSHFLSELNIDFFWAEKVFCEKINNNNKTIAKTKTQMKIYVNTTTNKI